MCGTWGKPARLLVLRNKGGGVFEDVTIATGLAEPISSELAGWGGYDNDGKANLFVCGEYTGKTADPPDDTDLHQFGGRPVDRDHRGI